MRGSGVTALLLLPGCGLGGALLGFPCGFSALLLDLLLDTLHRVGVAGRGLAAVPSTDLVPISCPVTGTARSCSLLSMTSLAHTNAESNYHHYHRNRAQHGGSFHSGFLTCG